MTVEPHPDREAAQVAEVEAIKRERPRYNRVHNQTPQAGHRMATMLARMPHPPERYRDGCSQCAEPRLPSELYPDDAGWFAVYDCCDQIWTRGFEKA